MTSIRVVCIEDEPDMIALIQQLLSRYGMQVVGAQNGREGIHMVKAEQPDLVLLDIMMPDMSGWTVYEQLKADPATVDIPVIVVTARAMPSERLAGLRQARVDDYIIKPFSPAQLKDSIERVLSRTVGQKDRPSGQAGTL